MADHYVDVVNENDEVIGQELKSKKPDLRFISRVVAVFIRNSEGKIIVGQRGLHKKFGAGKYDLSAFGNVDAGENYEQAAVRELREETELACPLTFLGKFYQENEHGGVILKIFCAVFVGTSDAEPKLSPEVISFRKMTIEEIEQELAESPDSFCEGFRNDFVVVKDKLKT